MNLQSKLESLFRTLFPEEELDFSKNLDSAKIQNWDSIAHLHLIVVLEKKFKINFANSEISKMFSEKSIFNIIKKKIK